MNDEQKFDFESVQDVESIKGYMDALAQGFQRRRIVLQSGEGVVELEPAFLLNFAIRAKRKRNESKITIKISWKDVKNESISNGKTFQIS